MKTLSTNTTKSSNLNIDDTFRMLAGWNNEPLRHALNTLAIAKFGESPIDSRFIKSLSVTLDYRANYMLDKLSGAIPYGNIMTSSNGLGNGCGRVFLKVCLINALYSYIQYDKCPDEVIAKFKKLDNFYYPSNTKLLTA